MFLGHTNITTTSTYLRSTPVRLKRALDKLEAAGLGQDSDNHGESDAAATPDQGAGKASNLLN
jgi:hypothetical protein